MSTTIADTSSRLTPTSYIDKMESLSDDINKAMKTSDNDVIYETYLQRTLGAVLPKCVGHLMQIMTSDPIVCLAAMLYTAADSQMYAKEKLYNLRELKKSDASFQKEQAEILEKRTKLHEELPNLKKTYREALREEKKILKWAKRHPVEFIPLVESRSTLISKRLHEIEAQEEQDRDSQDKELDFLEAQHRLYAEAIIAEREAAVLQKEKERKEQERWEEIMRLREARITDTELCSIYERRNAAHKKAMEEMGILPAMSYASLRKSSMYSRASASAGVEIKIDEVTEPGRSRRTSYASSSSSKTSSLPELTRKSTRSTFPSLSTTDASTSSSSAGGWSALEGKTGKTPAEIERAKTEKREKKRLARKQIQQAVKREDFKLTKDGLIIYATPSYGTLGLKRRRGRRAVAMEIPTEWLERDFHCGVFYEPELYVRCKDSKDSSVPVEEPCVPMSEADFLLPPAIYRDEKCPDRVKKQSSPLKLPRASRVSASRSPTISNNTSKMLLPVTKASSKRPSTVSSNQTRQASFDLSSQEPSRESQTRRMSLLSTAKSSNAQVYDRSKK